MTDYSVLEIWHNPKTIEQALSIARDSIRFSRVKESYFTNYATFEPHVWVVDAICCALSGQYYILEDS
jgi:hypothetical protein